MATVFAQKPHHLKFDRSTQLSMDYEAWAAGLDGRPLETENEGDPCVAQHTAPHASQIKQRNFSSRDLRPSSSAGPRSALFDTGSANGSISLPDFHSAVSLPANAGSAAEQGFNAKAALKVSASEDSSLGSMRGTKQSLEILKDYSSHTSSHIPLSPTSSLMSINDFFAPGRKGMLFSPKAISTSLRHYPPGLPKSPQSSPARSARRRRAAAAPTSPLHEECKSPPPPQLESAAAIAMPASQGTRTSHRRAASATPSTLDSITLEGARNLPSGHRRKGSALQDGRYLVRPCSEGELLRQAIGNSQRVNRDVDYGDYEEEQGVIAGFDIPSPSTLLPVLMGPNQLEDSSRPTTPTGSKDAKGKARGPRRHSQGFEKILEDFYGVLPSATEIQPPIRGGSFDGREVVPAPAESSAAAPVAAAAAAASPAASVPRQAQPKRLQLGEYILGQAYENVCKHFLMHRKELGSGQYGTVRKCKEVATGKIFACKTISKRSLKEESDVRDIQREVACLQLLQGDAGFVGMKGVYEDEGHVHIIMDLCRGGDLLDHIVAKGPLTESQAAKVCKGLVESLWKCHKLGIVHRDVKPENILLTKPGTADCEMKLVDFGVATFVRKGEQLHDIMGTPDYMAPEVFLRRYGAKADVWSAGVVLYAVLSGIPPFWASSSQSLKESILTKEVSFNSAKWEGRSEECKDLITKMLSKDPQRRISPAEILSHPWIRKNT